MNAPSMVPARPRVWTVLEVLRWTTSRFEERRIDTPRLDAELLIAHALGLARVGVYVQFERPLDAEELGRVRDLVKRRQAGEPVAYLTGHKEFWGINLQVDARVLVPRPDTETAVEEVLALLDARAAADVVDAPRVADVGTGSGAIALAVAKSRPKALLTGTDVSADALAVARANAERLGLATIFIEGDLDAPLRGLPAFDVIVANLPYIPAGDFGALPPEVRAEPRLALDGGSDGLDLMRRLCSAAPALLAHAGTLVLEVGAGQAAATMAYCRDAGLTGTRARKDLGGIERVVSACKP